MRQQKQLVKQRKMLLVRQDGHKENNLRKAMPMELDKRLNECARTVNDGKLLPILSAGNILRLEGSGVNGSG